MRFPVGMRDTGTSGLLPPEAKAYMRLIRSRTGRSDTDLHRFSGPFHDSVFRLAFTIIELVVVVALVVVLGTVFIPVMWEPQRHASRTRCISNMKHIGISSLVWGDDHQGQFPMSVSATNGGTLETVAGGSVFQHFQTMSDVLSTPKLLVCPEDKTRAAAASFASLADTNISYFLGVDAAMGRGRSLLSGDRNLTNTAPPGSRFVLITKNTALGWGKDIHNAKGHLTFGDGSAAAFKNGDLQLTFKATAGEVNRLAIP